MPDKQVVGSALIASLGSLLLITAAFLIFKVCGPGKPYFRKGNDDDYLTREGNSSEKGKSTIGGRDVEMGDVALTEEKGAKEKDKEKKEGE